MKDLEKKLLALLMFDKDNYFNNFNRISIDLFAEPIHKHIYKAIIEVIEDFNVIDIISVSSKLKNVKNIENEIIEIETQDVFSIDIENLLDELEEAFKLRQINEMRVILDGNFNASSKEQMTIIEKYLTKLSTSKSKIVEFSETVDEVIKFLKNKDQYAGVPTGFDEYDNHTMGFQKGDLITLAAETSQGKTSFAISAINGALKYNVPCLFISLEMSTRQLVTRVLSNNHNISSKDVLFKKMNESELQVVEDGLNSLKSYPLYIDDSGSSNFKDVINNIRRFVIQKNIEVVVVDYLQLMNNPNKSGSKEQEVGDMARGLKNIAKELDITVIELSQLSRDKNNPQPTMSRLRQSGQIEEASDLVILLFRPEYYGINEIEFNGEPVNTEGIGLVDIAKGRNAGTKKFLMGFIPHLTKWVNLTNNNYDEYDSGAF